MGLLEGFDWKSKLFNALEWVWSLIFPSPEQSRARKEKKIEKRYRKTKKDLQRAANNENDISIVTHDLLSDVDDALRR